NYYDNMMGRIEEPSFYDYKFLNKYYCTNKCKNKTNCPKPCYQDPKKCNSCACPTGSKIIGEYMYYIYGDKKVCGYDQIHASKRLQHIVISNITYCLYHMDIQGHNGHVFVRFPDFRGMFLSEECSWNNSIEIRFRKKIDHLGICLCYNKDIEAPEIVSEGKHMVVIFNFQIYRSYVHLEFMKVNSTNFEYKNLEEYQKIPRLLKKECNKKHDAPHDKCN
uniref:Metalloendopeptidase n=1 Tax=Parastrongyloides trichosuri TaxID=131310 RepID=A0A0N4Z553_PARTI